MRSPESFSEADLETEGRMFRMELTNRVDEINELIDASTVNDELKVRFREELDRTLSLNEIQVDQLGPIDMSRGLISSWLDLINEKDIEQNELFESVRDVVLSCRRSVKGWPEPSKN